MSRRFVVAVGAALAVVTWANVAQAHELKWGNYELQLSDHDPIQGADPFYRVVWHNPKDAAVRVPADLKGKIDVSALQWCPLRGCRTKSAVAQAVVLQRTPTPADKVKWLTVAKEGVVARHGRLADLFPKECAKGCRTGVYRLWLRTSPYNIGPLAKDMVLPEQLGETVEVVVAPRQLPVVDPAAFAFNVAYGKPKNGDVTARVSVTNTFKYPVFFPKAKILEARCSVEVVNGDQVLGGASGMSGGSTSFFDEADAVVLAPKKTYKFTTKCGSPDWKGATKITAKMTLYVPGYMVFELTRSRAAVHYFDAVLSLETKIR